MSRPGAGSADVGQPPEESGKPIPALSEQQRTWVREIAETIREHRRRSQLSRSRQGTPLAAIRTPNINRDSH